MSLDFAREGKAWRFSGDLHKELSISSKGLESTHQPPLPSARVCCAKPDWEGASHICMADTLSAQIFLTIPCPSSAQG